MEHVKDETFFCEETGPRVNLGVDTKKRGEWDGRDDKFEDCGVINLQPR